MTKADRQGERMLPNDRLGSEAVRLRMGNVFLVYPRKQTYLPILELLPPPALRERRHRGRARRLVAVHAHPKEVYLVEIDRRGAKNICATGISPERPPSRIREPHDGQRPSVCCRRSSIEVCAVASPARALCKWQSLFRCWSRELRCRKINLTGNGRQFCWGPCA